MNKNYNSYNLQKNVCKSFAKTTCSCKKSGCLKLYCECYAKKQFCWNCTCEGCGNREESLKIKQKEKKIQKVICKCTKSNCRKKYCECFKAGEFCGDTCRCSECLNKRKNRVFNKTKIKRKTFAFTTERFSICICDNIIKIDNF